MIMQNALTDCETCCALKCTLQAEEVLLAPTANEMAMTNEVTTSFLDANAGPSVGTGSSPLDYELADAQTSADLASFLSRPVIVRSVTWTQAQPVGALAQNISVWRLFANNAPILNKFKGFSYVRGNLKLKIVTNASPFLYGSLRAVYRPLPFFKPKTVSSGFPSALVPYSQMPGVWITPAHSEGAEFTCPFIWPKSFLQVTKASDFNGMGELDLMIYNKLKSANGASSGVTVHVFAWMEDVILAGPTVGVALQADEYGLGVVSAPASAVAAAASKLTRVPVIGRFAKATQIGASAFSQIAKLFGYTNVPVIEDAKPVRNSPFPSLASAEIGYPHDKLALDAKNELSIDPAIAGLDGTDELAISNFVKRESFLTSVDWSSASPINTPLFTSAVLPQLSFATGNVVDFTPMSLVAAMFRNWRGDVIFRFKFIATPFHKGRVRISYDPVSELVQGLADTGSQVLNKIVDLGAETDVEFRVPYQQALPWCYTLVSNNANAWSTSTTPALTLSNTFNNGMISMKVLTELSGPTNDANVGVQVFVRGADNLEFANPISSSLDLTPFELQSEEYYDTGSTMSDSVGASSEASTHRALVNFGESVKSLRTLMRRHNLLDTVVIPAATANTVGVYRINQTRMPPHYGFDPHGWNLAKGVVAPAVNFEFNFVNVTPWHLIANCFLAQRGSMNWVFNPSKGSLGVVSRISRDNLTFNNYTSNYVSGLRTTNNVATCSYWKSTQSTTAGSSLTHTNTTAGHAVVAPSYTPFKFQSTEPQFCTDPPAASDAAYDGSVYDNLVVEFPYDSVSNPLTDVTIERYFGIGVDYTLHFFMNCPTLTYLSAATVVPT